MKAKTRFIALKELTSDPEGFVNAPPRKPQLSLVEGQQICRIFGLNELDDLIVVGGLNSDAVTVANFSRRIPNSQITMRRHGVEPAVANLCDPLSIAQYIQEGYSLHVSNLQRYSRSILAFTDRLAFELGVPVKAEAFITPAAAQAFAEHYDTNDNFICQIAGEKVWRLYYPSFVDPLPRQPWQWSDASDDLRERLTKQPPDMEVVLKPGAVLWIPRGWIHAGTAANDTSLHITLRPEPVSVEWIVQRLVESLSDKHRVLRRTVGYRSFITPEIVVDSVNEAVRSLGKLLPVADKEIVGFDLWHSHGELFSGPNLRPIADVAINESPNLETLWVRPESVVGYWRNGNELHLHLGTARKKLDGIKASLVEGLLTNGEYVRVDFLVNTFTELIDWPQFISELKAVGFIVRETDLLSSWLEYFKTARESS